jgi:hypothetical protein
VVLSPTLGPVIRYANWARAISPSGFPHAVEGPLLEKLKRGAPPVFSLLAVQENRRCTRAEMSVTRTFTGLYAQESRVRLSPRFCPPALIASFSLRPLRS